MIPSAYKTFGVPVLSLPPIKVASIIVTEAQIRTLFSSPLTLIPGIPNKVVSGEFFHIFRELGTPYSGGGTVLKFQYSTGAAQWALQSSWLMTSGNGPYFLAGPPGDTYAYYTPFGSSPAGNYLGAGLQLALNTSDYSGGSGRLFITILYREWPMAPLRA